MLNIMKKDFFVIAHNIRSLYNVGSIFRTADAFAVSKIYLTGYTGTPASPIHEKKIAKVALGAEKWMPWKYYKSATKLIKELKRDKVKIIALENNVGKGFKPFPTNINKFKLTFPLALVLGEESRGINRNLIKLADRVVEIPMFGKKESLNVAAAFAVAAYQISVK